MSGGTAVPIDGQDLTALDSHDDPDMIVRLQQVVQVTRAWSVVARRRLDLERTTVFLHESSDRAADGAEGIGSTHGHLG
jgi:hypothetical protein